MCCSVLPCVTVCCSKLQCVAVPWFLQGFFANGSALSVECATLPSHFSKISPLSFQYIKSPQGWILRNSICFDPRVRSFAVVFLKNQPATHVTISNQYRADFWEILPVLSVECEASHLWRLLVSPLYAACRRLFCLAYTYIYIYMVYIYIYIYRHRYRCT